MSAKRIARRQASVDQAPELFLHISEKPDACDHDFRGNRDVLDDQGRIVGGTTVCTKCGMDAMTYSLRTGR